MINYTNKKQTAQLQILSIVGIILTFVFLLVMATPVQQAQNVAVAGTTNDATLLIVRTGFAVMIILVLISMILLLKPS